MTTTLTTKLLPDIQAVMDALDNCVDGVRCQQVLEMVVTQHCIRAGGTDKADFIADSFHKHIKQLLRQWT